MRRTFVAIVLVAACVRPAPATLSSPPTPGHDHAELPQLGYLARTPAEEWLVIVRPSQIADFKTALVFFGPSHAVTQLRLLAFYRERDGGSATVRFAHDNGIAEAYFPVHCPGPPLDPNNILGVRSNCPGVLRMGGAEYPLARFEGEPPDHLSFVCDSRSAEFCAAEHEAP